jgi:glutathione S-transferase
VKIYVFPVAPNPTKVRLYLAEKAQAGARIECPEIMVNIAKGEQNEPAHLARNPLGRLPVLELDDGSFLTESLIIIEYLEELYPDPPMIGMSPLERARVREAERICETGVLGPVAQIVHATNSPLGRPPSPEIAGHFRKVLQRSLGLLEPRLADGRKFVAGNRVSVADCTLQAALQFARFREVEIDTAFEALHRWDSAYRERPAAQAVLTL